MENTQVSQPDRVRVSHDIAPEILTSEITAGGLDGFLKIYDRFIGQTESGGSKIINSDIRRLDRAGNIIPYNHPVLSGYTESGTAVIVRARSGGVQTSIEENYFVATYCSATGHIQEWQVNSVEHDFVRNYDCAPIINQTLLQLSKNKLGLAEDYVSITVGFGKRGFYLHEAGEKLKLHPLREICHDNFQDDDSLRRLGRLAVA